MQFQVHATPLQNCGISGKVFANRRSLDTNRT